MQPRRPVEACLVKLYILKVVCGLKAFRSPILESDTHALLVYSIL